jgi:hypothetical protein
MAKTREIIKTLADNSGRPEGNVNDCTVRALVNASKGKVTYAEAEQSLAAVGREHNKGANSAQFTHVYKKFGAEMRAVCGSTRDVPYLKKAAEAEGLTIKHVKGITLARCLRHLHTGQWIISTRNHVLAVVDGRAIDTGNLRGGTLVSSVFRYKG